MPLNLGEPAPWFTAPTPSNPEFVFDTVAGRYVLLVFLPKDDTAAAGEALRMLASQQARFDDETLSAFAVVRDPGTAASVHDMRGLRWFLDLDGAVSRLYGALSPDGVENPMWLLLDPTLRTIGRVRLSSAQSIFNYMAGLKPPAEHAGTPLHAPVLIAPRIFEPDLCARLIALHEADSGRSQSWTS
jgi:peroxiredoxin